MSSPSAPWTPLEDGTLKTKEELIQVMQKAIHQLIMTWPALYMAAEHGWGGRDSVSKREQLIYTMQELFHPDMEKRQIIPNTMWKLRKSEEELSDWLGLKMDENFNVDLDDESHVQVARMLFELFLSCGKNKMHVVNQVMELKAPTMFGSPTVMGASESLSMSDDGSNSMEE